MIYPRSEMRLGLATKIGWCVVVPPVGGVGVSPKTITSRPRPPIPRRLHPEALVTAPSGRVSTSRNSGEPRTERCGMPQSIAAGATPTSPQGWPYLQARGSTKVDMQMPARAVIPSQTRFTGRGSLLVISRRVA